MSSSSSITSYCVPRRRGATARLLIETQHSIDPPFSRHNTHTHRQPPFHHEEAPLSAHIPNTPIPIGGAAAAAQVSREAAASFDKKRATAAQPSRAMEGSTKRRRAQGQATSSMMPSSLASTAALLLLSLLPLLTAGATQRGHTAEWGPQEQHTAALKQAYEEARRLLEETGTWGVLLGRVAVGRSVLMLGLFVARARFGSVDRSDTPRSIRSLTLGGEGA
jgi:hypothetical protein